MPRQAHHINPIIGRPDRVLHGRGLPAPLKSSCPCKCQKGAFLTPRGPDCPVLSAWVHQPRQGREEGSRLQGLRNLAPAGSQPGLRKHSQPPYMAIMNAPLGCGGPPGVLGSSQPCLSESCLAPPIRKRRRKSRFCFFVCVKWANSSCSKMEGQQLHSRF